MKNLKRTGRALVAVASLVSMFAPSVAHAGPLRQAFDASKDLLPGGDLPTTDGSAPSGTTVVSPGNDLQWLFTADSLGGPGAVSPASHQGYGLAPAGGPNGVGALRQRIGVGRTDDRLSFGSNILAGRHLGSISELSYWTWSAPKTSGTNAVPALHLTLDLDGDGLYTGFTNDDVLVFEPHHQTNGRVMLNPADSTANQCSGACIVAGTWQEWDGRLGRWYSRRGDGTTQWNGENFESIEHYLSRYQSATIALNPASLAFRSGGGWNNTEVYIDALKVDGTIYDFEPTIEAVTARTPTWRFQTSIAGDEEFAAKWSDAGSRQGLVDGPAFTGNGSLQQVLGSGAGASNDYVGFGTPSLAGKRLDALTDASYATFVESGSALRTPVLSLRLDLNGDGGWQNNTGDDTIQFIGSHQSTPIVADEWQHWRALTGVWYSRRDNQTYTMPQYIASNPDAKIGLSDASVLVQLGSGSTNTRTFADSVSIDGKLFDLEPATQVVTPADGGGGWFFNPPLDQQDADNNRQRLVNGPGQPPAGQGSLSQKTSTTKLTAVTPLYAGKRLRDITALSYWTYRANSTQQMPSLKIHLDADGDMVYTSFLTDKVLVFEPAYQHAGYVTPGQPALATDAWQRWDAIAGGWYVAGGDVTTPSGCTPGTNGPPVCKLADLIDTELSPGKKLGDMTIALGPSSIDLQVSPTGSPDVYADRLNVNGTVFDFEAAVPSRLPGRLDGNRASNEGYELLLADDSPVTGTADVEIYGTCSASDIYLYIESPNADVTSLTLLFDANGNDRFDGLPQDRTADASPGSLPTTAGAPIPGSDAAWSYDEDAFEIKIPRSFTQGGWFQYDVTTDTGRNTGWGTATHADATGFAPDPCTYVPRAANGAMPLDCSRHADEMRLVQHLLDRGPGHTVKLSGTCRIHATPAHGGDQVHIIAAGLILDRDGVTLESLDATNKARIIGSGTQAGIFVAPGTSDATVRSLWLQSLSRGIVTQNSIRTTIGFKPPGTEIISPFGNRILGVLNLQEGILATGAGAGMGNGPAQSITVQQGNLQGGSRMYAIPTSPASAPGKSLIDVTIAGNYISYNPPGPLTTTSDVTGIVVRQNGSARQVLGVDVSQNAVGMASTDFPSFNYAGIRIHADSNDPTFAHIRNVSVFKNSLGRIQELDLSEAGLPDAGDLQATGRTGIAIGRVADFNVTGNSIRTILSAVPGLKMIGGGIVVYDSFDGVIRTNSVITIAGNDTADADLGAIGIVDDLMRVFNASAASGKPTENILLDSNYAGWAREGASDLGTQRGIVVNGASNITTNRNQMKTTSAESLLISIPIAGVPALGGAAQIPAMAVKGSFLCTNWLNTWSGSGQAQDQPVSKVRFDGENNGSTNNSFPGGSFRGIGNNGC